ncbi:siderophore-interacting protein [Streptomyces corynorhini]|uniref:Siderophore-interacting protein n=1 Tax=Streptomyces corynorhini TaxID=2282652 RepID=A0A370ATB6_9ACTN|nr:siderophore-interacting protein [Streptomyces corynorhini]RDG31712.1 siderophore-interacting protein [Streptomyces corynorhini]
MNDAPFQFFDVEVVRTERLTPAMARVVLGGADLSRMASGGRDQRLKLFFPQAGQREPVMPDGTRANWYDAYRALDPAVRAVMRTYTARELRHAPDELVIDFALHGGDDIPAGPATRWVRAAAPGDRISVLAPVHEENAGFDFRPPEGTDWVLLTGDESALPAVAGILESLPPELPARVWIEVHDPADRQDLLTKANAEITWLVHGTSPTTADALRTSALPDGTPYAWIAGESATVKAVRRQLVGERGLDRKRVKFSGYWRRGASEDHLMNTGEAA